MAVFFTSDLHLRHKFVAGARRLGSYENVDRDSITPEDVQWHDDLLATNWDATVGKDDVVWMLGDLTGGGHVEYALEWVKARPGIKHLIVGNHDKAHPLHRDSHKFQRIFLDAFASVQMASRRKFTLSDQTSVYGLLSHFPFSEDHSPEARYTEWRLRENDDYLLHGHTHSTERFNGKEIHVGVDAWDFTPVPLEEIVDYITGQELAHML